MSHEPQRMRRLQQVTAPSAFASSLTSTLTTVNPPLLQDLAGSGVSGGGQKVLVGHTHDVGRVGFVRVNLEAVQPTDLLGHPPRVDGAACRR